jgi:ribonuclease HI
MGGGDHGRDNLVRFSKAIKSQVLANFVAEWVDTQLSAAPIQPELWTMYFDGSLMKTGVGAGLLFISPLGKHLRYVLRLHFPASNNMAEYEALVNGLRIAIKLGVRCLDARGDSQLVIDQVMNELPLPRPEDGGLLRRGSVPGRQVLRARAQPRRSMVQRDCGRAG